MKKLSFILALIVLLSSQVLFLASCSDSGSGRDEPVSTTAGESKEEGADPGGTENSEPIFEKVLTSDGLYTYVVYKDTEYEAKLKMNVDLDEYIIDGQFDLAGLFIDCGWTLYGVNNEVIQNPADEEIVGASIEEDGITALFYFGLCNMDTHQLYAYDIEFVKPFEAGTDPSDAERYYELGNDDPTPYEHYNSEVILSPHEIEYVVRNFGYDKGGNLTLGLTRDDIIVLAYSIYFLSQSGNMGFDPYYSTTIEGEPSVLNTCVYKLP